MAVSSRPGGVGSHVVRGTQFQLLRLGELQVSDPHPPLQQWSLHGSRAYALHGASTWEVLLNKERCSLSSLLGPGRWTSWGHQ
jgi:hypothetical protein